MDKIIRKIPVYIDELYHRRTFPFLKYHNLHHTEKVVERSYEIAKDNPTLLTERELFCLITAAWFHDTGHLFNELKEHELVSVDLMGAFLKSVLVEDWIIEETARCIMATKSPTHPESLIEKIICDADTYHYGTKEFWETDPRVYEEMEERLGVSIEQKTEKSIQLLETHRYYTAYCQELLNKGKMENIARLKKFLQQ